MPKPPPFPIGVDDLTVDFLSSALALPVRDFDATRIGADRGMLGEVFRLTIDVGSLEPTELVAKFAAPRADSLASAQRGRTHERELRCFEDLLADTPVRAPAYFGSWYDPETAHFLLLQAMVETDHSVDQLDGVTLEQARLVVDQMALLHARWWSDDSLTETEWLPRLDASTRIQNLTTLVRVGWAPLVAILQDDLPSIPVGFGEALPDRVEAALRSLAALPHTLLHCDLRADNLLFDPTDGSVTLIDWQGCGIGPAAFDLAYFLSQSLTVEMRRAHERELTDLWHDRLITHGVEIDRDEATAGYREALWFSMAVACAVPVVGDPDEPRVKALAHAMATRVLAALHDHDQLMQPTDPKDQT